MLNFGSLTPAQKQRNAALQKSAGIKTQLEASLDFSPESVRIDVTTEELSESKTFESTAFTCISPTGTGISTGTVTQSTMQYKNTIKIKLLLTGFIQSKP